MINLGGDIKSCKRTHYNAFNVYRRELASGTVNLTGDRAQGHDSKYWTYSRIEIFVRKH